MGQERAGSLTRRNVNLTEKEGTCFICYEKQEELCLVLTRLHLVLFMGASGTRRTQHLPTQEMMKLGEVTKTEGEWIEKFLLMLKESLNAPHDLSHCLNQVLSWHHSPPRADLEVGEGGQPPTLSLPLPTLMSTYKFSTNEDIQ